MEADEDDDPRPRDDIERLFQEFPTVRACFRFMFEGGAARGPPPTLALRDMPISTAPPPRVPALASLKIDNGKFHQIQISIVYHENSNGKYFELVLKSGSDRDSKRFTVG